MSSLVVSIRLVSSSSVYIFWCPPCPCWLQDAFGIGFVKSWDRLVPTVWSFWFIVHIWFRWFRSELLAGSSNFCVLFGAEISWQVSPWWYSRFVAIYLDLVVSGSIDLFCDDLTFWLLERLPLQFCSRWSWFCYVSCPALVAVLSSSLMRLWWRGLPMALPFLFDSCCLLCQHCDRSKETILDRVLIGRGIRCEELIDSLASPGFTVPENTVSILFLPLSDLLVCNSVWRFLLTGIKFRLFVLVQQLDCAQLLSAVLLLQRDLLEVPWVCYRQSRFL
jgi:hypothetical protein